MLVAILFTRTGALEKPERIYVMNERDRYDSLFQWYGQKYGYDWNILKAQAIAESALDSNAISKVGAKGLTQFMDRTWLEWRDGTPGIQDIDLNIAHLNPYDPEDAIRAQAAYMSWLKRQTGGVLYNSLMAYNWGIGNFKKWRAGFIHDIPEETKEYIKRIYGLLEMELPEIVT
jgi:soluble lytic murein transglycosylase-like protein